MSVSQTYLHPGTYVGEDDISSEQSMVPHAVEFRIGIVRIFLFAEVFETIDDIR